MAMINFQCTQYFIFVLQLKLEEGDFYLYEEKLNISFGGALSKLNSFFAYRIEYMKPNKIT